MPRRDWVAILTLLLAATAPERVVAQGGQRPVPHPVVPPQTFQAAIEAGTRTTTGAPGPRYWQQWARYEIRARLDVDRKHLEGSAEIVYHNNSPDTLGMVFLHLLQNLHAPGAIRNEPQDVTGGVELARVAVGQHVLPEQAGQGLGYTIFGTVLGVTLPQPLVPDDSVALHIDWGFTVPQNGAGRMGWSRDNLFHIAYWYPQMAVYDDVVGWHLDEYLGNAEFYVGFGRYDVTIEAPPGWLIRATGAQQNAADVFPAAILERLRRAERSDTVVHIMTADDFGPGKATKTSPGRMLAWRFVADSVRDFAFSATRQSLWDAARTPVGDRDGDGAVDYARVDALYRATAPRWRHVWRYAQHSIDFLSRWTGISYPWPHMTVVEGAEIIGGGMEFPMVTLIGDYNTLSDSALYYVTAHELAHMWMPMIVASDEKRHSWMDEGTTSFNENQARKEFYPGIDHDDPDRQDYLAVAGTELEGEMSRWSDYHYPGPAYVTASYRKPATLLATLRALLGEEAFTEGLRTFFRDWAYKHPKPWDFFQTFNTTSGTNLDWFWRSWYYETWTLDHAIAAVVDDKNGTTITVEDRGLVPMPARLAITRADGRVERREIPVEHWLAGERRASVSVPAGRTVVRVELDPERGFPDVRRGNNVWER